jgi:hypothetical protein
LSTFSGCSALTTVNINPHPIEFEPSGRRPPNAFEGCPRLSLAVRKKLTDSGYTGQF